MPPRDSKSSFTPAAVDDSRKTADALWLFEQFLNCDPPVSLNVTPISEKTGMKPNTIVKRINTMQHRYPGFGIVTRTTGPRQSSNFAPATPKVSTDSLVKKSAFKSVSRETRSKKMETIEANDDDSSKKQTRARKRGERGGPDTKTEADRVGSETQICTDDDDIGQPSNPPAKRRSKETKSQKKVTSKEPLPGSDDDADDSEKTDAEDEAATEIATPKTRGGRKSAGIGKIKDIHAYPERPAPRGRHAIARKDKVPDGDVVKSDVEGGSTEDTEKNGAAELPNCAKRKRSETLELQSSPLTPSPVIRRKLVEMGSIKQPEINGSNTNQLNPSDMSPLSKKQKTNDDPSGGESIETEAVIEERCSSDSPGTPRARPAVTISQEDTSTEVEHFQSSTTETSDAGPNTAVEPEQPVDKSITTPTGQHIDEIPSPSNTSNYSSGRAAEDGQVIGAPESPTTGRGWPVKLAPETGIKTTAVLTPKATVSEISTARPEVVREVEPLPNFVGGDFERANSTSLSSTREGTTTTTTLHTKVREIAAQLTKAETPDSPRSSEPRQPIECEWTIYNPTTKPSKAK